MCGIVGYLPYREDARIFNMQRALESLAHRGPDGQGIYQDKQVALGHRRLSIIDLNSGQQPLYSEDRSLVLIVNGEIYNYRELKKDLDARGHCFATGSDSEVIIHAYEEYGLEKCLSLFNGMFVFALWDRGKGKLVLCRDRFGIKPCYYSAVDDGFLFASEIKALFASGMVEHRLRREGLFEYFTTGVVSGERTLSDNVFELPPAHYLIVDASGQPFQRQYWDLLDSDLDLPSRVSEESVLDQLDDALQDSVNYRLISDVPVGLLLSGGVDSSLLAYYIARNRQTRADAPLFLNAKNRDPQLDESYYARLQTDFLENALQRRLPFESHLLEMEGVMPSFYYLTYLYDEPMVFPASFYIFNICRIARERGLKVLLAGEGADEVFFGYERFERTLDFIQSQRYPQFTEDEIIYFGGGIEHIGLVEQLTGVERGATGDIESFQWLGRHSKLEPKIKMSLHSISYRMQSLLTRMDRMGMGTGVEIRVPFLDHHVVRFSQSVPMEVKYQAGALKSLLKRLARDRVHPDIIQRKKMGSPADVQTWLMQPESKIFLEDLISDTDSVAQSLLNKKVVDNIIASHYTGERRYPGFIWMMMTLEVWNRVRSGKEVAPYACV